MLRKSITLAALGVALVGGLAFASLSPSADAQGKEDQPKEKKAMEDKKSGPEFTRDQQSVASQLYAKTVELIDTLRPDLYRYCYSLTANPFDAEDLVQETLAKALSRLSQRHSGVENPKAYLFRIATNAWIDEIRRNRPEALAMQPEPESKSEESKSIEVGEAFVHLAQNLGPRERAIVVLREAFGLPLKEVAAFVGVSESNARVMLHRSRKELEGAKPVTPQSTKVKPPEALVDRWVEAFNKRDAKSLVALLAEYGESDIIGVYNGVGEEVVKGIIEHTFPDEALGKAEKRIFRGEPIVILWYTVRRGKESKQVIRDIVRIEGSKDEATRLTFYYFCKDVLYAVAKELGVEALDNEYHYPIG